MCDSTSQSLSKFHLLFNNGKSCTEKVTKLDFVSSFWDDDRIKSFDENNWQCLWWGKTFQAINTTKSYYQVLRKKGMHIKICY